MNPSYEDFVDQTFSKRYRQLELDIMRDIVRRIKKTSEITSSADWQIMRLTIMGNSSEEIRNMIKEAGELSENDMQKLFNDVIEKEYTRSADLYKEVGANFVPYEKNTEMQQLTQALITQSNNELKSITGTMGFMLDYGDGQGLRFTPHTEIFDDYLNSAVMGIASGAFDYNTMIRKVVTQMTNSGLRTVDYASGRHDRVDVAARRAVLTGLSQLTGRITDTNAAALNTDHFEVAWHAGARPTHQEWQGRVWSKKELVDVCGLGSVTGLLGANCYHDYYPFIPGVSERMYSDEWLDQMNREENTPKIFKGKEYTAYEARQHQRYIERCMRAQREKVELLKEGGADKDEVMLARCKYQAQLDEYKRFSKVMKLPEQRERIYYDMKGRVAPPRDVYQQYLAEQAEKRRRIQTEADKHKERAEEGRRADMRGNIPSFKGDFQNYKDPKRVYTLAERQMMAEDADEIVSQFTNRESKWSGKVVYEFDNPYAKLLNCDISLAPDATLDIAMHENLHSRSISHCPGEYSKHEASEEASVQLMTELICREIGITPEPSAYQGWTDHLKEINKKAELYEVEDDFVKDLFEVDPTERYKWLYKKVHDKIDVSATIQEQAEIGLLLQEFEPKDDV